MYNFKDNPSQYLAKINAETFPGIAFQLFHYQYQHCDIYREYVNALNLDILGINEISKIPFLPVSFFKTHPVVTDKNAEPELVFESSGTTGENNSRHFVLQKSIYEESLMLGFESFYGPASNYIFFALLPSYLERKNASLVHMAKTLMERSADPLNGFYLDEWEILVANIKKASATGKSVLLLGVTFALLDFAEAFPIDLSRLVVMETGGMKGRKKEWTRTEVHDFLKKQWQLPEVHSEYGMTELLSQAYSKKEGIFQPSVTMKVLARETNDPLSVHDSGSGCLNIIDLANIHSCAFIATEDIGTVYPDGSFQVLGRMDFAALRGCSLMTV